MVKLSIIEIHDEMIGMPVVRHEPLRVQISMNAAW